MGLVVGGELVEIDGLTTTSFRDDAGLILCAKVKRTRQPQTKILGVVLHTTKGIPGGHDLRPQDIRDGAGEPIGAGVRCVRSWNAAANDPDEKKRKLASAHLVMDFDASVACCADLKREVTYHAGKVNERTIGIEVYQGSDAELYQAQLEGVVILCTWLCDNFDIVKQVQWPYHKKAVSVLEAGAFKCTGIWGHRDCSNNRGEGDPGDPMIQALVDSGFDAVDFELPPD